MEPSRTHCQVVRLRNRIAAIAIAGAVIIAAGCGKADNGGAAVTSPPRSPHTFRSPALEVEVQGYATVDRIKNDRQEITPEPGFRLVRFQCKFTIADDAEGLNDPHKDFHLMHRGVECRSLGAYAFFTGSTPNPFGPVGEVKKDGLELFNPMDVFFVVPADAADADLTLSAVKGQAIPVTGLPQLKPNEALPIDKTDAPTNP